MPSQYFDERYALYLLAATAWTTLFSMTIQQPLRGCRNLGILACYAIFLVMLFRLRFLTALATWCVFGIAGGLLYLSYELVMRFRTKEAAEKPVVSLAALIHGPLAWPIMIPEVIEYTLAELGLLAPKTLNLPPFPPLKWDGLGWNGEVTLQSWAGFQSRRGAYSSVSSDAPSDGRAELSADPGDGRTGPPSPMQVSAFQFLLDSEGAVAGAVLQSIFLEYPKLRDAYDFGPQEAAEVMPAIDLVEQLKPLIGLFGVHVLNIGKDGIAYIGYELGCTWDAEHGLGVMTHRDSVVGLGQAETSFRPPERQ